ncbi:hypothetical protein ONS95_001638 [Cadophora gregata]|uniref:uncharacterized protein n=1 Tax=Cadophora gregata TaxID=51156 RepID=UPI0026DBC74C|nr:uncharacterized protein ONS95_001638 [Cadophora gregata]KAK0111266.1 hypothetical protein ONS95_001638 [Cadophora gregata]KAK0112261.1 hypothetical protein ONS96_001510 [Cadophora gregata f. sp. sojae]
MIQDHLHEDRVRTDSSPLRATSAITGRTGRKAMIGDMIGRDLHEAERVIQIEIEKDTNRLVEREAAVAHPIMVHLQIAM